MTRSGRVQAVTEELVGAELKTGVSAGATSLVLEHVEAFDDRGGSARLRNLETDATESVVYTRLDDATGTIYLAAGTAGAWTAGDTRVEILPLERRRWAAVLMDDADETLDVVDARVPIALWDRLPLGVRHEADEQEAIELEPAGLLSWKLLDVVGQEPVIDGTYIEPTTLPPPATSDGSPPASSPTPTVIGGVGILFARWTPPANADALTYEVHVSTSSGFTPSPATLVAETASTVVSIRTDAAGATLSYGTTYYVKIVAYDADGVAPAGAQTAAALIPATSEDLAVGAVIADIIASGTLLADLIIAGRLSSAESGRRWEADGDGVRLIEQDETTLIDLPTDPLKAATFRGSVVATVLEAITETISGTEHILPDAQILLETGIADPQSAPSLLARYTRVDWAFGGSTVTRAIAGVFDGGGFSGDGSRMIVARWRSSPAQGTLRLVDRDDPDTLLDSIDVGARDPFAICTWLNTSPAIRVVALCEDTVGAITYRTYSGIGSLVASGSIAGTLGSEINATRNCATLGNRAAGGGWLALTKSGSRMRVWVGTTADVLSDANTSSNLLLDAAWNPQAISGLVEGTFAGVACYWVSGDWLNGYWGGGTTADGIAAFRTDTGAYIAGSFRRAEHNVWGQAFGGLTVIPDYPTKLVAWVIENQTYTLEHNLTFYKPGDPALPGTGTSWIYSAGYTWYDQAVPTHESGLSPIGQVTAADGMEILVTLPPLPPGEPDRWRLYGEFDAQTLDSALDLQATLSTQPHTLLLDDSASTTAPPASSTFVAAGVPGRLKSAALDVPGTGHRIDLRGDGYARLPKTGLRVYKTGDQALTVGTAEAITWGTHDWESEPAGTVATDLHDVVTNNSRFKVPAGWGGIWRLHAEVTFTAGADNQGRVICTIRKNGSATILKTTPGKGADAVVAVVIEWEGPLVAGDYLEVWAQSATTDRDVESAGADDTSAVWTFEGSQL